MYEERDLKRSVFVASCKTEQKASSQLLHTHWWKVTS